MKLIGIVGFADSGKGTASGALIDQGYFPLAFADPVKDCLAAIFHWPRHLLEGDTAESRAWRMVVDPWWAAKLGIPDFTPRKAMQLFGTEVMRDHMDYQIWVWSAEKAILNRIAARSDDWKFRVGYAGDMYFGPPPETKIVLTDLRFFNEIDLVRQLGGTIIRTKRGPDPEWFDDAGQASWGNSAAMERMIATGVHRSEWEWIGAEIDYTIENDSTIEDLRAKMAEFA